MHNGFQIKKTLFSEQNRIYEGIFYDHHFPISKMGIEIDSGATLTCSSKGKAFTYLVFVNLQLFFMKIIVFLFNSALTGLSNYLHFWQLKTQIELTKKLDDIELVLCYRTLTKC